MSDLLQLLTDSDLSALAAALRSGRLAPPFTPVAVLRFCAVPAAAVVAEQMQQLADDGMAPRHLPSRPSLLLNSRRHAAWMFKKVVEKGFVGKGDCAVIVNVSEEEKAAPGIAESLAVLSSVARLVNVHHYRTALKEFKNLKKLHVGNGSSHT
jgi:hypothetical protein